MGARPVWRGDSRVDITFSHRLPTVMALAERRVESELTLATNFTLRYKTNRFTRTARHGQWHGVSETAVTYSIVGVRPDRDLIARCVETACSAGCEAIQVETWSPEGYRVEEWRVEDE